MAAPAVIPLPTNRRSLGCARDDKSKSIHIQIVGGDDYAGVVLADLVYISPSLAPWKS